MTPETGQSRGRLVIVTGSGRSGTSTVAGTLKRLGLYIPQPEIPPDDTNPRGFYEPAWVVDFHKRLLHSIPARTNDARPLAAAKIREATDAPDVREALVAWLAEQVSLAGAHGQLAIKDPRAFWFHDLWKAAAAETGLEVSFLTMLRHPAEVAQSRDSHYLQARTEDFRRVRQTANIAGWVNAAFETDRATRGSRRAFVRFTDLMTDWRVAMTRAGAQLGVTFNTDLSSGEHHEVDEFIDVKLHRAKVTWGDTDTLAALRDLAEVCWDALNALVEDPDDQNAIAALEAAHPTYVSLHEYAEAIALDHTNCEVVRERRRVNAVLRERHAERLGTVRKELREARQRSGRLHRRQPEGSAPGGLTMKMGNKVRGGLRRIRGGLIG